MLASNGLSGAFDVNSNGTGFSNFFRPPSAQQPNTRLAILNSSKKLRQNRIQGKSTQRPQSTRTKFEDERKIATMNE